MTTAPKTDRHTVQCRSCGHAVAVPFRQTVFCPHCGRRLRSAGGGLRTAAIVAALLIGGVAVATALSWRDQPAPTPIVAVAPLVDPTDAVLADARLARAAQLADLDRRASDVRAARQALVDQVADLSNLSSRVTTAVARAADENRWPAKVGGRSLLRTDADDLLNRIAGTTADEQRAIDRDGEALARIAAAAPPVRSELADVDRLRQELATTPTADRRADIVGQAAAYRDHPPQVADGLTADPTRPIDADALLH